ncbi:alcohol dehydrogenase [Picrophilus oshimae]|uniref:Hypothetical alcohol dehydrogenase n=1 Tax=Picrophilus torridus (strain ATCC 700027 / DSM 9790 / JCM 10055 / NBRC 100828 / KAW 2/3) TaxID=1122961 RepID=Q6L074_PICTO|nr:alcohol dehydrogenase [Picrophilus oshimae]AAT43628.1 hypothetical alcohol dehydrogenase [Picrophilus oshimae DSM 9789]
MPEAIFEYYINILGELNIPMTLRDLDFNKDDVEMLIDGTLAQQRLLSLSPKMIKRNDLRFLFNQMI